MTQGLGHRNNPHTDYALHDAITGVKSEVAERKRWWMRKLAGPDSQRYARMLLGLPPLEE